MLFVEKKKLFEVCEFIDVVVDMLKANNRYNFFRHNEKCFERVREGVANNHRKGSGTVEKGETLSFLFSVE